VAKCIEHLQDKQPQKLNELDVNYRTRRKNYRRNRRRKSHGDKKISKNQLKSDEKNLKNFEFWECFKNLETVALYLKEK
jgi:hypothetical protein